jgi:hypothetical protein
MKLSIREAVARSYPGWNRAEADRMIAWLDRCGYAIVEKDLVQAETPSIASSSIEISTVAKELV